MSVTLGQLNKFKGNAVAVHCCGVGCNRSTDVLVDGLVATYGSDKLLYDLPFKCKCGSTRWLPIVPYTVYAEDDVVW